jgi:hypothetical protein
MQAMKPEPTTTPGNRRGRVTETEVQRRVDECRQLLIHRATKAEIKRVMRQRYGADRATTERYLASAREALLIEIRETKDWMRAQSLAVYSQVIRAKDATHRDRIKAQAHIDKLLGLHAPIKVAATDVQGNDIPPDEARDRLSALASTIAERIRNAEIERLGERKPIEVTQ